MPRAGIAIAARGNHKRRTRKLQSPRAAFFISLQESKKTPGRKPVGSLNQISKVKAEALP
jgi:hypothetical protein